MTTYSLICGPKLGGNLVMGLLAWTIPLTKKPVDKKKTITALAINHLKM